MGYDIRQHAQGQGTQVQGGGVPLTGDAQPLLVSGVNLKTINGKSLLGAGNILIDVTPPIIDGGDF